MSKKIDTHGERWSSGAVLSFIGGILLAVSGGVLTADAWLQGSELHPWLRLLGTLLLVSIIPALLVTGFCLDRESTDRRPTNPQR